MSGKDAGKVVNCVALNNDVRVDEILWGWSLSKDLIFVKNEDETKFRLSRESFEESKQQQC